MDISIDSIRSSELTSRKIESKDDFQSDIANCLKQGKDLLLVQAFAGHKYPSTIY